MLMNKESLYLKINELGLTDESTIKESQELDQVILAEMLKYPNIRKMYMQKKINSIEMQINKLKEEIVSLKIYC